MTTILLTDDMIGWDSQLTFGDQTHPCSFEKVFVDANGVWAFAGSPSNAMRAIKGIVAGEYFTEIPGLMESAVGGENPFEIFRMWEGADGERHVRYWSEENIYGFTPPLPMALGTGSSFVLGAYYGAERNVNIAMKLAVEHDAMSGGEVHVDSTLSMWDKHLLAKKRRKEAELSTE